MIEEMRPEDTPRGRFCFPDIADCDHGAAGPGRVHIVLPALPHR